MAEAFRLAANRLVNQLQKDRRGAIEDEKRAKKVAKILLKLRPRAQTKEPNERGHQPPKEMNDLEFAKICHGYDSRMHWKTRKGAKRRRKRTATTTKIIELSKGTVARNTTTSGSGRLPICRPVLRTHCLYKYPSSALDSTISARPEAFLSWWRNCGGSLSLPSTWSAAFRHSMAGSTAFALSKFPPRTKTSFWTRWCRTFTQMFTGCGPFSRTHTSQRSSMAMMTTTGSERNLAFISAAIMTPALGETTCALWSTWPAALNWRSDTRRRIGPEDHFLLECLNMRAWTRII